MRGGILALTLASVVSLTLLALLLTPIAGCQSRHIQPPPGTQRIRLQNVITTGYDSGPESCGWKRNWLGRPVYAYGPLKGKPKVVGQTASGAMATWGTLAADTRHYPFGTVFYIPGYGYGIVEDRGGAIKGPNRLDLWFPSRAEALQWGRKTSHAYVWLPPKPKKGGKK